VRILASGSRLQRIHISLAYGQSPGRPLLRWTHAPYHPQLGIAERYKGRLHATSFLAGSPRLTHSDSSHLYPPPLPLSTFMHPAGLSVFVREVLTAGLFWLICALVIILPLLYQCAVRWWATKGDDMPTSLDSLSISTIVPFVRNRYDFLNWGFQSTGETVFRFRLLNVRHLPPTVRLRCSYAGFIQKPVVAVSGESGRSAFLTARGFDIQPGFKDLLGGVRLFSPSVAAMSLIVATP